MRGVVLLAGILGVTGAWAADQSLGELAAREKERKARDGGKPPKVYTEYDLRGAGSGTVSQPGAEQAAPAEAAPKTAAAPGDAAAAEAPKTEEEQRAEQEQNWRQRRQEAQAEVDRLQKRADEIQGALNDLTQNLYGGTRTAQLTQLEQTQKDLAAAQRKVADLDEEGRRSRYR
jgi:hypothetical protein